MRGSTSIRTFRPSPTCQPKQLPSQDNVFKNPFQMKEVPMTLKCLFLSHHSIDWLFRYFILITWCHKPVPWSASHKLLRCSDILNHSRFLMPQPPQSKGRESHCHSTRWKCLFSPLDPQRKAKINFLNLLRIDFGTWTREKLHFFKAIF